MSALGTAGSAPRQRLHPGMLEGRERVLVIGSPGAGKSTLAVQLGARLGLPVVHLDALHWQPGWVALPREQWQRTLREQLARPRWILDGNYRGTMALRMEHADAVVFLDLPRRHCVYGVLRRFALGRVAPRAGLPAGCRERLSRDFLRFVWRYPVDSRPQVEALLAALPAEVEVVRLRSRAGQAALLRSLASGGDRVA